MAEVFMSYSHTDRKIADDICTMLDELSISFFRDEKDIEWGDRIPGEVELALTKSNAVIVVVSPGSLKSHWVPYEIGYARALGKRILPYLTHPSIDPPGYMQGMKYQSNLESARAYFNEKFPLEHEEISQHQDIVLLMSEVSKLRKAFDLMPNLLLEMKEDIKSDDTGLVREFVILPSKSVPFGGSKPRFAYFEDEHENLRGKVDILLDYYFIHDVSTGNVPIYRMNEEFIQSIIELDIAG